MLYYPIQTWRTDVPRAKLESNNWRAPCRYHHSLGSLSTAVTSRSTLSNLTSGFKRPTKYLQSLSRFSDCTQSRKSYSRYRSAGCPSPSVGSTTRRNSPETFRSPLNTMCSRKCDNPSHSSESAKYPTSKAMEHAAGFIPLSASSSSSSFIARVLAERTHRAIRVRPTIVRRVLLHRPRVLLAPSSAQRRVGPRAAPRCRSRVDTVGTVSHRVRASRRPPARDSSRDRPRRHSRPLARVEGHARRRDASRPDLAVIRSIVLAMRAVSLATSTPQSAATREAIPPSRLRVFRRSRPSTPSQCDVLNAFRHPNPSRFHPTQNLRASRSRTRMGRRRGCICSAPPSRLGRNRVRTRCCDRRGVRRIGSHRGGARCVSIRSRRMQRHGSREIASGR